MPVIIMYRVQQHLQHAAEDTLGAHTERLAELEKAYTRDPGEPAFLFTKFFQHQLQADRKDNPIDRRIRGDRRAAEQQPEHVPVEHVAEGGQLSFDAKLDCLCPQLFGDARHPDDRIDRQRRQAEQIGYIVALRPVAEDGVKLVLQHARHIDEKEQTRREKVDEAVPEALSVRMLKSHVACSFCRLRDGVFFLK